MLSKEFCRRIGWFKPDGGLKDMMARVAMLAMHRDGLIALPAPQGRQTRISHRRIVWSLIIYCKQTVIEIFGKRQKYRVFFRSGPFFVRRREGLHGFGEPLQGALLTGVEC